MFVILTLSREAELTDTMSVEVVTPGSELLLSDIDMTKKKRNKRKVEKKEKMRGLEI